jgi:predicted murein hydrolase (TIGR00659 family)
VIDGLLAGSLADVVEGPVFLTGLTCLVYAGAKALHRRRPYALLHPVLISVAALIAVLSATGIEYETYRDGTVIIDFLLGVSVVALALPLYRQVEILRRNLAGVSTGVVFGGLVGLVVAVVPFLFTGTDAATAISAAPSSITTPIAMIVSEISGGIPSLTAAIVVITGILGAVIGPIVLKLTGVTSPVAFGLAMGTAAHGIGTARALQDGQLQGASATVGLCLNGLFTAAVMPVILPLLLPVAG